MLTEQSYHYLYHMQQTTNIRKNTDLPHRFRSQYWSSNRCRWNCCLIFHFSSLKMLGTMSNLCLFLVITSRNITHKNSIMKKIMRISSEKSNTGIIQLFFIEFFFTLHNNLFLCWIWYYIKIQCPNLNYIFTSFWINCISL